MKQNTAQKNWKGKIPWNSSDNQRGGVFAAFLPFIALLMMALIGITATVIKAQNHLADLFRLDACARKISSERAALYTHLVRTNKAMRGLQYAVYSARGMKLIPGAGVMAQIGETAALMLLQQLEHGQDALILASSVKELPLLHCHKTQHSKKLAYCTFSPLSRMDFTREHTLFPDVPGRIRKNGDDEILLTAKCNFVAQPISSQVRLLGTPELVTMDFRHEYQK